MSFLTKIFGSSNQRSLKRMQVYVNDINKLEESYQKLSDSDFLTLKNNLRTWISQYRPSCRSLH